MDDAGVEAVIRKRTVRFSFAGLYRFALLTLIVVAPLPALPRQTMPLRKTAQKIEVLLAGIDAQGLRGPAGGKGAVAYEFCIPNTPKCRRAVRAIDPTVQFMLGSAGRIRAKTGQCLCIGSTHQKNYRRVLQRLVALPYVARIIECRFE